jgi:hypothetical protein
MWFEVGDLTGMEGFACLRIPVLGSFFLSLLHVLCHISTIFSANNFNRENSVGEMRIVAVRLHG